MDWVEFFYYCATVFGAVGSVWMLRQLWMQLSGKKGGSHGMFLRSILLLLIVVLGFPACGEEEQQYAPCPWARDKNPSRCGADVVGFRMCCPADLSADEADAVADLSCALESLGLQRPEQCLVVVRGLWQGIPRVCKKCKCAETWKDLVRVIGVPPTKPEFGYRGYCGWHAVMVRRFGDTLLIKTFRNLLVHEYTHALGYNHGDEMRAMEAAVKAGMKDCAERRELPPGV